MAEQPQDIGSRWNRGRFGIPHQKGDCQPFINFGNLARCFLVCLACPGQPTPGVTVWKHKLENEAWLGYCELLQKKEWLCSIFALQDLWMQHKEGSRSWWDWPRRQLFSLPACRQTTFRVPILRSFLYALAARSPTAQCEELKMYPESTT